MKTESIIQFIKFGLVGVSNTAVDWVVFFLLSHFVFHGSNGELISKAISFAIAVINSYIWNSVWTFRKEYSKATSGQGSKAAKGGTIFVKFLVISLLGWGLNYLVYKYTHQNLAQGNIIALIAASGAATLLNFFGNKLWTYKK